MSNPLRVVCLADTHGRFSHLRIPRGDVLIHAGDLTSTGSLPELGVGLAWLGTLPHRHKILVAGNHDFGFELKPDSAGPVSVRSYVPGSRRPTGHAAPVYAPVSAKG